jgi:DNA-binding NtrC family response regulator
MTESSLPRRVALLVEDDRDLRSLEVALLEESLEVVEADSAEEALHYLREHADEVALLMTDIRLPCLMDGVDLAQKVSRQWPWIRVVVTSGNPGDRLADLPGTATYIPKPWRALDLLVQADRAVKEAAPAAV